MKVFSSIIVALLGMASYACAQTSDIVDVAIVAQFTTLVAAVQFAGLEEALRNPEAEFTVFAPTDAAFAALPDGLLDTLLTEAGKPTLTDILLYHVLGSRVSRTDLFDGLTATTLNGEDVTVTTGDDIKINDSVLIAFDVPASNGIIHVINAVLIPPSLVATPEPDIVDTAVSAGFSTLVTAVEFTGLVDALKAPEPLKTVFAPTNEAFSALDPELLGFLLTEAGKETLTLILLYHVVAAKALSTDLSDGQSIDTLAEEPVVVTISDDGLFINESKVIRADIEVSNGVIHAIDAVLIPPSLREEPNIVEAAIAAGFDTLVTVVELAGLVDALAAPEPLKTVFAPTNEAFAALDDELLATLLTDEGIPTLTNILLYHVVGSKALSTSLVDGQEIGTLLGENVIVSIEEDVLKINDSTVIARDIEVSNGVIHAIDAVLIPPSLRLGNIVDVAIENGFDTLVAAVTAAGLVDALSDPDADLTVFAPTNEAFAALGDEILSFLVTPPGIPALTEVLLYHVVGSRFPSESLFTGLTITTLLGSDVTVNVTDAGEIFINDSLVIAADVPASNGIIHAIDAVLIPPGFVVPADIPNTAIALGGFDTLVAALTATDLVEALSFPNGPFTVFAPTDEAFGALPFGALQLLLKPDGLPVLTDILLYHVVSGSFFSTDLSNGLQVPTLFGANVTVSFRGSDLFINESRVVAADVACTNGVIHAIDAVLLFEGVEVPLPELDIVDTAIDAGFTTLVAAVQFTELVDALRAETPIKTVFAPTNEAFAALPEDIFNFLLTDNGRPTLTNILLYHVLDNPVFAADLVDGAVVTTLLQEDVTVSIGEDGIFINESQVLVTDVIATNGVIHVIDAVLLQESLFTGDIGGTAAAAGFEVLVAALEATDLLDAVSFPNGPLTVFAPTDDAFFALPFGALVNLLKEDGLPVLTDILLYHVVAGAFLISDFRNGERIETLLGELVVFRNRDGPVINQSNVISPDIVTSNGIIHVIDAVLLLDEFDIPVPEDNIVDIAIAAGFDTLVAAVEFTGLTEALEADAPAKTVFAPTDEAFAALPEDLLGFYLGAGEDILRDILLYHVVAKPILAADLVDGAVVTTLLEEDVTVTITPSDILINDSKVLQTDIIARNGVIHVIDAVLLQPSLFTGDIPGTAVGAEIFNTLVAALGAVDLVDPLSFPNGPFTVFAPTDEAFASLPGDVLEQLLLEENLPILSDLLLYHVVSGVALAGDLEDGQRIETVFGQTVEVSITEDGDLFINDSQVIAADIITSNGVVHAIDEVLIYLGFPFSTDDIVDIAIKGGFDTLVAAVTFTGLVDALKADSPLKTVFAPTNEAFAALPEGIFNFLLTEAGKDTLRDILLYHVVEGQILEADLSDGAVVTTFLLEDVTVSINDDGIFINESEVIATDILATNGVIHVIDAVLLQPSLFENDIVATAKANGLTTLVAALEATDLDGAVSFPNGPFTVFAPTNQAFADLGDILDDLLEDEGLPTLADILLYHVVSGVFLLDDIRNGERLDTLFGQTVVIRKRDVPPVVNKSNFVVADVTTSNGVVHVIDAVLLFRGLELP